MTDKTIICVCICTYISGTRKVFKVREEVFLFKYSSTSLSFTFIIFKIYYSQLYHFSEKAASFFPAVSVLPFVQIS